MQVQCLKCGGTVVRESLKRHQLSAKCEKGNLAFQPPTPVRERVSAEQTVIWWCAHYQDVVNSTE